MKYINEFLIIITISFIGELLNYFIPLPIPGSVYGLVLMFICLLTKIIKIEQVKHTSLFLIEIMPIMFIPAGVGLLTSFSDLKPIIIEAIIITIVTTFIVMGITGLITQRLLKKEVSENE